MDTLSIEIICWLFFFITSAITTKAHKDENKILRDIFGAISIILAIVGLLALFVDLSPFLTTNPSINSSQ